MSSVTASQSHKDSTSTVIDRFTAWSTRWIPDSMVFVLFITIFVFILAAIFTKHGPVDLLQDYWKGFWALLTFAMQMSILMITGFAVADSKPVKRAINALIDLPNSPAATVAMYSLVVCFLWWLHWGIGMMVGIIMGREIAVRKRGMGLHYPMLAAISYCGCITANGPAQAAQLLLATPGHFIEKLTGVIPITLTSFDPLLLSTNLFLMVTTPILFVLVMPKPNRAREVDDATVALIEAKPVPEVPREQLTPAERWDRSAWLQLPVAVCGLICAGLFFYKYGITRVDLNSINFVFVFLALLLHKNPRSFVASVQRGTATVYGVIIQFPMYAGVFGMISFSGLAGIIAHWFVAISTAHTFPWIVFVYTSILDFFVPSAGSKFVIEAPYIIPAAQSLGVSVPHVVNAYTFGSDMVAMIQPFWALPTLGAFKLRFQDVLGFSAVFWAWGFVVVTIALLCWPGGF